MLRLVGLVATSLLVVGCPGSKNPAVPIHSITLELGRDQHSLRGVAGDPGSVYTALSNFEAHPTSIVEARRGSDKPRWAVTIDGTAGPLVRSGELLAIALGGTGSAGGLELRGSPGAALVGLDANAGGGAWKLAIDSSEWALISSLSAIEGGVLVGGSFSGTLRAADKIVSSAGKLDGFVARVDLKGNVAWLLRVGGANADAVTGVAARGDRIAITGTFATGAELQGEPLVATDDKAPSTDVFVAELDGQGTRRWSASFGGRLDDSAAGVAIDSRGRLAVAATVRDHVKVDVVDHLVRGPSDGLLVYFDPRGSPGPAIPLGGEALDGLTAITAAGDRIVVGGFYAGTLKIGKQTITANGDDAFLAVFDGATVTGVWEVAGNGREEIAALSSVPNGFIAGIGHTAGAKFDGQTLTAPKDPTSGAGVIVRGVR